MNQWSVDTGNYIDERRNTRIGKNSDQRARFKIKFISQLAA